MYVCVCKNVTEKDINRAVSDGASSFSCLQEQLEVATCCGQCRPVVSECLEKSLESDFSFDLAVGV